MWVIVCVLTYWLDFYFCFTSCKIISKEHNLRILLLWTDTMTKITLIRTFNWSRLRGSEVQSIIKARAWHRPGRHGAGDAESSTFSSEAHQENADSHIVRRKVSLPTSTVTQFLQWGHTKSNKTTSPNSATAWAKNIQTTTNIIIKPVISYLLCTIPYLVWSE